MLWNGTETPQMTAERILKERGNFSESRKHIERSVTAYEFGSQEREHLRQVQLIIWRIK
jgi:hypothetical protein